MPENTTSALTGLTSAEAAARLARFGENSLPPIQIESPLRKLLLQFNNPLIFILLFALAVDAGIWIYQGANTVPVESITILLILVANAALGFWQNLKSDRALFAIAKLTEPRSWVIREGQLQHIESRLLVPGDCIRVEAGERIAADGSIMQDSGFMVDESVVTGESAPVSKMQGDNVLSGTLAAAGFALVEIISTGADSNMGKLATLLGGVTRDKTPLEKRIKKAGRKIAIAVALAAALLWAVGVFITGLDNSAELFLFTVALAVAAVPESLPAVITLALALGVERMAKRQAVVKKMSAVEALGSVTVIATDKTGTLTENNMSVHKLDCVDTDDAHRAMILVNDADPDSGAGDPMELGMLKYIDQVRSELTTEIRTAFPVVSSRPFDARWKYMRVTVSTPTGTTSSYLKGAPEVVLNLCKLSSEDRAFWNDKIENYAGAGFRTLALARGEGETEDGLQWLGLVVLLDPPRPEVSGAIREARNAGIRVIMLTGDHPATASEIARQVGINADKVVTGENLDKLTDEEFGHTVAGHNIFARVSPEHKLKIVGILKQQGQVVAVTGDGVNDAPALKAADVGIAMGQRGSDVSREVADLVLLDDNFATIVAAIEEGRNIFENIQKFIRFLFAANFSEVALISIGSVLAFIAAANNATFLLPLTAAQILWINLLTDSLPALAISVDRNPGVLGFKPQAAEAPLLNKNSLQFVLFVGVTGSAFALGGMLGLSRLGFEDGAVQSFVFCYLALAQLTFVNPSRRANVIPAPNNFVTGALLIAFTIQVLVVAVPGLRVLLELAPLNWPLVAILIVFLIASWLLAVGISNLLRIRQERMRLA